MQSPTPHTEGLMDIVPRLKMSRCPPRPDQGRSMSITSALVLISLLASRAVLGGISFARALSSRRRRGAGEGSQIGLHSTAASWARDSCTVSDNCTAVGDCKRPACESPT